MRHLFEKNIFRSNFDPLGNNHSSGRKVLIKMTHRRALDLSKNGKPSGRNGIPMPIGAQDRRVEIPIEWPLGNSDYSFNTAEVHCLRY
jgi:hypothetical protein